MVLVYVLNEHALVLGSAMLHVSIGMEFLEQADDGSEQSVSSQRVM